MKTRIYAIMNTKEKTLKEYHLQIDAFGKVYCFYSQDIVEYKECDRYVNPFTHFIKKAHDYIYNEHNELVEILENKTYAEMEESFNRLF